MALINNSKSAAELLFETKHRLFLNFNAHTDQTKNSIQYLNNNLGSLLENTGLKSTFNYLDVGCGFGNKTLSIIKFLEKFHSVNTIALDPSNQLLSVFKEKINGEAIELIGSTWEDYQPSTNFNFISSIHTFYYIDNWDEAIHKMVSLLDNNGVICIALRSNDSVCQFRDYFFKKIHDNGKNERNCEELCETLKRQGIHYKIDYVDSILDINDCLMENDKGKQLIEFLLRQPYKELIHIKDEIISYLKNTHTNGFLSQKDGYIWISKQLNEGTTQCI